MIQHRGIQHEYGQRQGKVNEVRLPVLVFHNEPEYGEQRGMNSCCKLKMLPRLWLYAGRVNIVR